MFTSICSTFNDHWSQLLKHFNRHFPDRCPLCKQLTFRACSLCPYCANDLIYFDYTRSDNLLLQPDIAAGLKQRRFERLISLAPYQWPFDQWVADLKFRSQYAMADLMALQLADLLRYLISRNPALQPDAIVAMPIHPQRRSQRGYNQAQLMTQILCAQLKLPVLHKALTRIKPTNAQTELNRKMRRANVKDAFAYNGPEYKHIAIVDDVITTGATVNEVCKLLKQKSIKTISVWTICATPLHHKPRRDTTKITD